ncbi:hypothetical protein K491DRAFT_693283 [Lophiostoma macrostomum CBS 122681]|uniref:Zn(2)-C6 fungal-type domain-containing protein n=1 Tax=Lophiostoma macrostomum CBS 122681 TaxID=1314788 RepID=A0A6A6T5F4_9PLEO|nr:hypothetical protein K491DRAFT_693283 [Lophiostoma macrostomum CBS 122681]
MPEDEVDLEATNVPPGMKACIDPNERLYYYLNAAEGMIQQSRGESKVIDKNTLEKSCLECYKAGKGQECKLKVVRKPLVCSECDRTNEQCTHGPQQLGELCHRCAGEGKICVKIGQDVEQHQCRSRMIGKCTMCSKRSRKCDMALPDCGQCESYTERKLEDVCDVQQQHTSV